MAADLLVGSGLATLVAVVSFLGRSLSKSGVAATILVGTTVFGCGGWNWAPPILFFFISSSLLSGLGKKKKIKLQGIFQKDSQRDWAQVLANGFLPALLAVIDFFNPQSVWCALYVTALTAANADTWGTELGVLSRESPILITSGKTVPAGTSGGVTRMGTLSSLAGALSLSAVGLFIFPAYDLPLNHLIITTAAGLMGSFFDSLLGAALQAQYICAVCGTRTERKLHCQTKALRVSGVKWVNNDAVNLFSSLFAIGLGFLLIMA